MIDAGSAHPDRDVAAVVVLDDWARRRASARGSLIRVLVAEPQALVRAGYRTLLESEPRITVVGEVASANEAIALAAAARPDVLLLDLGLPGLEDAEATARTISHPAFAGVAVMLIAQAETDERVFSALRGGAVGILGRDAQPAELIRGIRMLARGEAMISAAAVRRLFHDVPALTRQRAVGEQLAQLTDRERVVLSLVARGLTNTDIAEQLVISPATAKTHVSRAMVKLGVRHRAELVVLAYETGLVQVRAGASSPASANDRTPALDPSEATHQPQPRSHAR